MLCKECTNKPYCPSFKNNENMGGCGDGIPEFHPAAIAEMVVRKVNRGVNEMDLDRAKFSREVLKEVKKALSKTG